MDLVSSNLSILSPAGLSTCDILVGLTCRGDRFPAVHRNCGSDHLFHSTFSTASLSSVNRAPLQSWCVPPQEIRARTCWVQTELCSKVCGSMEFLCAESEFGLNYDLRHSLICFLFGKKARWKGSST